MDAPVAFRPITLTDHDFRTIAERVRAATGIVLGANKRDLVYGRLSRRLRELGCADFAAYLAVLDGPDGAAEQGVMVNAITTNLTGFFREAHHFDHLSEQVMPALAASGARRLRIWSAGCSSGEEPYSAAMAVLRARNDLSGWDAAILATDIDTDMVATAHAGIYDAQRTETIPEELRRRFVVPGEDGRVRMAPKLKQLVHFKPLNLLGPWPMRGPFDAIFCRNVVIYFDKPTQSRLFARFADLLTPDGWLYVGHSESLFRVCDRFRHLGRTIYRKCQ